MPTKELKRKTITRRQIKPSATPPRKVYRKQFDTSGLPLYDRRMLELMALVLSTPSYHTSTQAQFLESIAFPPTNLIAVRRGTQSFRAANILTACDVYGLDARFFFDEKHKIMFAEGGKASPLMFLKQAVVMVENELKGK